MDNITILDGEELRVLLDNIVARDTYANIHTIRFNQREDGISVKINSGTWTPTIGRRADSGGY